jgi:hypothetical protein
MFLVIVVILDARQDARHGGAGNECGADPVVDQSGRDLDGTFALPKLRDDLALAHLFGALGVAVRPEERFAVQRLFHGGFGLADIRFESLQGLRLQLHRLNIFRHRPGGLPLFRIAGWKHSR